MDIIEQTSAGAILCVKKDADTDVVLLVQNNAFYKRSKKEAVIDIGPKGRVNKGETIKDAALREIREETGLDVTLDEGFMKELHYEFEDIAHETGRMARIKKTVMFYIAYISESDIDRIKLSEEHIGCRLLPIDDAIKQIRHENQKEILRAVAGYVNK